MYGTNYCLICNCYVGKDKELSVTRKLHSLECCDNPNVEFKKTPLCGEMNSVCKNCDTVSLMYLGKYYYHGKKVEAQPICFKCKNMIEKLTKPSTKAQKILDKFGIENE